MKTFSQYLWEAEYQLSGSGWIRPDGKIFERAGLYNHGGLARRAGYMGQFDALLHGAVRFTTDRAGAAIEVERRHTKSAAKLIEMIGDRPVYYVDVVTIKNDDLTYDIVDSATLYSLKDVVKFLRSK